MENSDANLRFGRGKNGIRGPKFGTDYKYDHTFQLNNRKNLDSDNLFGLSSRIKISHLEESNFDFDVHV